MGHWSQLQVVRSAEKELTQYYAAREFSVEM